MLFSSSHTCSSATLKPRGNLCSFGTQPTPTPTGPSSTGQEPAAAGKAAWRPLVRRVAVAGVDPHRVYHLALTGLEPGQIFALSDEQGRQGRLRVRRPRPKAADQPHRFVVFGDCGAGTAEEKAIAYRTFLSKPDFVMITGDIVYGKGLVSEYRDKYWPIIQRRRASPSTGAPLLRSTLFVAAPGNHDIASRDLGKTPDGLAYFYYWYQPLNGPIGKEGGPLVAPVLGPDANQKAFLDAAGKAFPRMANFSFDYGNAHWTVLDANATVDWTDPELQRWVASRPGRRQQGRPGGSSASTSPASTRPRTHFERAVHADPGPRLRGGQGRRRVQRPCPQLPAVLPAPVCPVSGAMRGAGGHGWQGSQDEARRRQVDARQVVRRPRPTRRPKA